jgi:hypothetical protein
MFRRLAVAMLAVAFAFVGGPAVAAPTTETHHAKGLVESFVDVVPSCDQDATLYNITTTSNLVEHRTLFPDGREHDTFTQTGTFVAEPLKDASLPSYSGKFTIWGGFNANGKTVNGTFTFNLHGSGSDGSTLNFHSVDHFNQRPDGSVQQFMHCH